MHMPVPCTITTHSLGESHVGLFLPLPPLLVQELVHLLIGKTSGVLDVTQVVRPRILLILIGATSVHIGRMGPQVKAPAAWLAAVEGNEIVRAHQTDILTSPITTQHFY